VKSKVMKVCEETPFEPVPEPRIRVSVDVHDGVLHPAPLSTKRHGAHGVLHHPAGPSWRLPHAMSTPLSEEEEEDQDEWTQPNKNSILPKIDIRRVNEVMDSKLQIQHQQQAKAAAQPSPQLLSKGSPTKHNPKPKSKLSRVGSASTSPPPMCLARDEVRKKLNGLQALHKEATLRSPSMKGQERARAMSRSATSAGAGTSEQASDPRASDVIGRRSQHDNHPPAAAQPQPKPSHPKPARKTRWSIFGGKSPDLIADADGGAALGVLQKMRLKSGFMEEHAFPDLMELAERRRAPVSEVGKAALRCNPCGSNINAAENMSRVGKRKLLAAHRRFNELGERPGSVYAPARFKMCLTDVGLARPFFFPPVMAARRHMRGETVAQVEEDPAWMVDVSVYARRRAESEGKAFFDYKAVYDKRIENDWNNAISKQRFRKVIAKADDEGAAGLKEELQETMEVFQEYGAVLARTFNYYTCGQTEADDSMFTLKMNAWGQLSRDMGFANNKSKFCKTADVDNVFIAANFEEDADSSLGQTNDDLALMRFEFLEALTRVALLKFGKEQGVSDVSDSVRMLLEAMQPKLPQLVKQDSNVFRVRLYSQAVAETFEEYLPILQALYAFFRSKNHKKCLHLEHWLGLCSMGGWTRGAELGTYWAKVAFVWSQMAMSDEVKLRAKLLSLSWVEYLEAIARVAEFMDPEPREVYEAEIEKFKDVEWVEMCKLIRTSEWQDQPGHAEAGEKLAKKVRSAIEGMLDCVMAEYGCDTLKKLQSKLEFLTKASGGELYSKRRVSIKK